MFQEMQYLKFFNIKNSLKKDDEQQKDFLQNTGLPIVKDQLPLKFLENVWFKHPILYLCPFLLKNKNSHEILLKLVKETKQVYVLPKLEDYIFTRSFDLWMSKGAHDIFTLVINFLGSDW
jgi:hypothetical protein